MIKESEDEVLEYIERLARDSCIRECASDVEDGFPLSDEQQTKLREYNIDPDAFEEFYSEV